MNTDGEMFRPRPLRARKTSWLGLQNIPILSGDELTDNDAR
jgi:hypothetical protein